MNELARISLRLGGEESSKHGGVMGNRRGQGLVEYLILVCLVGIAAIAVVSVVGTNVREQYARISNSLRNGKGAVTLTTPDSSSYRRRGMDDFTESATTHD